MYQPLLKVGFGFLVLIALRIPTLVADPSLDSLLHAWPPPSEPRARLVHLLELAKAYERRDPQQTLIYAQQAIRLADSLGERAYLGRAYGSLAVGHLYLRAPKGKEAQHAIAQTLKIADELEAVDLQTLASLLQATWYMQQGLNDSAFEWFQRTVVLSEKAGDAKRKFMALNSLTIMYMDRENPEAEAYAKLTLKEAQAAKCDVCISAAHVTMGNYLMRNKQLEAARDHYLQAYDLKEKIGDRVGAITVNCNLCEVNYLLGEKAKAQSYIERGIQIAQEAQAWPRLVTCLAQLASVKLADSSFAEAWQISSLGISYLDSVQQPLSSAYNLYLIAAMSAARLGDYAAAYHNYRSHKTVSDSLLYSENQMRLQALQIEYQANELALQNQLLENQVNNQRLWVLASVLGILLLAGIAFFFYARGRMARRAQQEMEALVAARTQALREANTELAQANQELESFVYIASHDFKEPLRNISSFAGLIQRRLPPEVMEAQGELFDFIKTGVTQLQTLVRDINEYAHARKLSLVPEPVAVGTVLEEVEAQLATEIAEKAARLDYAAADLPELPGYRVQLYLVLKNLIENALKYARPEEPPRIRVWVEEQPDAFSFAVADNGLGIPEAYHSQVFQLFKRLHSRHSYQGSGMGLGICVQVLQAVGGRIWIDSSQEGVGTTFKFSLPRQLETVAAT